MLGEPEEGAAPAVGRLSREGFEARTSAGIGDQSQHSEAAKTEAPDVTAVPEPCEVPAVFEGHPLRRHRAHVDLDEEPLDPRPGVFEDGERVRDEGHAHGRTALDEVSHLADPARAAFPGAQAESPRFGERFEPEPEVGAGELVGEEVHGAGDVRRGDGRAACRRRQEARAARRERVRPDACLGVDRGRLQSTEESGFDERVKRRFDLRDRPPEGAGELRGRQKLMASQGGERRECPGGP